MSDIWHDPLFLAALKKGGAGGTASGNIVTFNAPKAAPLKALTLAIDPIQDLHGFDSPWPGGGGKNKLVPVVPGGSITWNDVTLSAQNGELYLNGKPTTSGGRTSLRTSSFTLPAGTYSISCITTQFVLHDTSDNIIANTLGTASFTLTEDTTVYAGFNVIANTQYSGVLKAQIEEGSTATTYAPYSNLCPISGWDEVNLWRTGKNMLDDSNFTTFNTSFTGWAVNDTGAVSAFNTLKAGTYTMSLKSRIDSVNSSDTSGAYGIFIKSVSSDGELLSINCRTSINTAPTVGQIITSTVSFRLTDKYVGKFTNAWSYSGRSMANKPDTITIYDFQIELSSTATPYAPYSGNQFTIQLGQTVYGGTLDVVNGVLTVDRAEVDLGTLEWTNGTFAGVTGWYANAPAGIKPTTNSVAMSAMASDFTVIRFNAISTKVGLIALRDNGLLYVNYPESPTGQLVYELAQPIEYTLTASQLDTLDGQNVVWGDSGEVSLEYAGGGVSKDMMLAAILHEARQ